MASWAPGGDTSSRIAFDSWDAALRKWDKNQDRKLTRREIEDANVLDRFYRMDLDQSGDLNEQEWNRHAEIFQRAQNVVLAIKPSAASGELSAGRLNDADAGTALVATVIGAVTARHAAR